MASAVVQALKTIVDEKGIPYEAVLETLESALAAAYRKDFGDKEKPQNIKVNFDPETGAMRVFDEKTVISDELYEEWKKEQTEREAAKERGEILPMPPKPEEETAEEKPRFHPKLNLSLSEARQLKGDAELGEVLRLELPMPGAFGRMAAQTAKQVIIQKLREVERDIIFNEYKAKEGELITAVVQRREGLMVLIDLGKATAILSPEEQIMREDYRPGSRVKVYVLSVEMSHRGPNIRVSRTHPNILRKLFEIEIPEVAAGTVILAALAREAGVRSKVAVYSKENNIDPIGSCIGQRGTRIQTIISELGGEKIDIIEFSEDPARFIANSLSPAKVVSVKLNEEEKIAVATVMPDQFSLSIGRGGQNVRLAAELTGWKISVREEVKAAEPAKEEIAAPAEAESVADVIVEEKEEAAVSIQEAAAGISAEVAPADAEPALKAETEAAEEKTEDKT